MKGKPLSREAALLKLQQYCAYQDRCHQEVRGKLLDLGVYGDDLEAVMAELIAEGFLVEERFARSFARGKFRLKQWGRQRIVRELRSREISDYCIRKALEEIEEEEYRQTLADLLTRKNRELEEPDDYRRRHKLADFGIRKGFEAELVWEVIGDGPWSIVDGR